MHASVCTSGLCRSHAVRVSWLNYFTGHTLTSALWRTYYSVLGVIPTIVFAPKLCVCPGVSDLQDRVTTWTEKG